MKILTKIYNLLIKTKIMNTTKATGTVKWFDTTKGYGFIAPDNAKKDVFVHSSAVKAAGLDALYKNQKVEFDIEEKQGRTSAINVSKVSD